MPVGPGQFVAARPHFRCSAQPVLPKETVLPSEDLALRLLGSGSGWQTVAVRPFSILPVAPHGRIQRFPGHGRTLAASGNLPA